MKGSSPFFLFFFVSVIYLKVSNGYESPRFSSLTIKENKDISKDMEELNAINNELIDNEKEDEDDDDEESEGLGGSDFNDLAHESLEQVEEQATIDLENSEIENILDKEIYRIIQERLKKLWYIGKCRRDYSNLCPLGWKISEYDTGLCIPPETYEGQCRSIDFSNSKDVDKELFAWKCEVQWPCINSPKLKIMGKCPFKWTLVGNSLCIAPEDYVGKCSPAMDFSNYDYEHRARWANDCDAEWSALPKSFVKNGQEIKTPTYAFGGPVEENGHVLKIVH
ncbi:CPW-WPC family protein [Plasmodium vinckei lentum]|uniref:CPW-WPC family protein n=1 Tax=Plasmodium vinckei lentum TaxID=138297 RepID=A0A6V7SAV9_PLAVN|nr:CPW-WPC family protein [Plasmodium vinckei lentum]